VNTALFVREIPRRVNLSFRQQGIFGNSKGIESFPKGKGQGGGTPPEPAGENAGATANPAVSTAFRDPPPG
jgi:hypothetical protein